MMMMIKMIMIIIMIIHYPLGKRKREGNVGVVQAIMEQKEEAEDTAVAKAAADGG